MVVKLFESEFDDGIYIFFKNLHKFDRLSDIIKNYGVATLLNHVVGICSIINIYKINDFEFNLFLHEDLGICIRLPLERDSKQDEKNYELLRKLGKELILFLKTRKK